MNIGILHLTDLHICNQEDFILNRVKEIVNTSSVELDSVLKLFIVVSGDIANSGDSSEYILAKNFLETMGRLFKDSIHHLNAVNYIVAPGNHDCNFNGNTDIRDKLLLSVPGDGNDDIKPTILNECVKVQDDFWNFNESLTNRKCERISSQISFPITIERNIIFNIYNTSWCSAKNEAVGSLMFPKSSLLKSEIDSAIVVSMFHHPTSWLSPNTTNNNKRIFEKHLLDESNIVLCGHEHEGASYSKNSMQTQNGFAYFEGIALQNRYDENSGYNLLVINTEEEIGECLQFRWKDGCYAKSEDSRFSLNTKKVGIVFCDDYRKIINELSVPLKHSKKEDLMLSDIFIYPDLEPINKNKDDPLKYISASELLTNNKVIIEGESQSGRTSLLYKLMIDRYEAGCFPIFIEGKNIKNIDIKAIVKRSVKLQYGKDDTVLPKFNAIDKSKKIVIIDNFDDSLLNPESKGKLIDKFSVGFGNILITVKEANEVHKITESETVFADFSHYKILPLGYLKRNELVEKWIRLGLNKLTIQEDDIARNVKITFDTISNLIGEQLIPSHPFFILTLLQSLDNQIQSYDMAPTSYAYCYHSLIHISLIREKVPNDRIGSVFNFLAVFSFKLYESKKSLIKRCDLESFYNNYNTKFIFTYSFCNLITILTNAIILKEEEGYYFFSYKYLSFFLTAKHISTILSESKGKKILNEMCNNLHVEENANILVFLTHHTNNNDLLEEILFASMLPFENYKPITLKTDDQFFKFLSEFVTTIKNDILPENSCPRENRNKALANKDRCNRVKTLEKTNIDNVPVTEIVELSQTYKVIKILGQIIKNQHGNFEKDKLVSFLESSYNVCFRSIDFLSTIITAEKKNITAAIIEKQIQNKTKSSKQSKDELQERVIKNLDEKVLEKKISDFLQFVGYRLCLQSFSNLSLSVGTINMENIYDIVAKKIDTPAAKLITFTIKTYYGKLSILDLQELHEEFKKNPVASHILKARVASYVYNNHVPHDKKAKIVKMLGFKTLTTSVNKLK